MGYYWDHIERKYHVRPRWQRRPAEERRCRRRESLLQQLVAEIQDAPMRLPKSHELSDDLEYFNVTRQNERAAKLYATLLVRALVGTDEVLMQAHGKQIAELIGEGEKVGK